MNDELVTRCASCGAANAATLRFCTSCGTPMPEPEPVRTLFADETAAAATVGTCGSCGAALANGLRFCTSCGSAVSAPETTAPTTAIPAVPAAAPPPRPPGCARCGAALAPGLAFCTTCGMATGVAPVGQVPQRTGAPRRSRAWLAGALVLLLVAGGGAAAWFVTRDDDIDRAVDREPSSSRSTDAGDGESAADESSDDTSPSTEPEPSVSASASASVVTPPPAPDPVTCWDGSGAELVSDCSLPSGRAGLEYVFPTISGSCKDLGSSPSIRRTLLVQCNTSLADGTRVKLNYSQWESVGDARAHYDDKLPSLGIVNGSYTWAGFPPGGGDYNIAGVYTNEPFSVSAYAPTQEDATDALVTLVRGQTADEVRGRPTS